MKLFKTLLEVPCYLLSLPGLYVKPAVEGWLQKCQSGSHKKFTYGPDSFDVRETWKQTIYISFTNPPQKYLLKTYCEPVLRGDHSQPAWSMYSYDTSKIRKLENEQLCYILGNSKDNRND